MHEVYHATMILGRMETLWARDKWLSGAAGRWKLGVQKAILKARRSQSARARARRGLRRMDRRQATGSKLSLGFRIWELEIVPEAACATDRDRRGPAIASTPAGTGRPQARHGTGRTGRDGPRATGGTDAGGLLLAFRAAALAAGPLRPSIARGA